MYSHGMRYTREWCALRGATASLLVACGGSRTAAPREPVAPSHIDGPSASVPQSANDDPPRAAAGPRGPDPDDGLFGPLPDVEPIPRPPDRPKKVDIYDVQAKAKTGTAPALPVSAVSQTIVDHYAAFAACNDEARKRVRNLEGLVLLRFVIGADGSVSRVRDVSETFGDEGARACLMKVASVLRFSRPQGGVNVHVQLALYFEQ